MEKYQDEDSEFDFENFENEDSEDETLADKAYFIGIANSTNFPYKVKTSMERAREKFSGGKNITVKVPVNAMGVEVAPEINYAKPSHKVELPDRTDDVMENINPEEFSKVQVTGDGHLKSKQALIQLYKVNEEKPFFVKTVKVLTGLIIIEDIDSKIRVIPARSPGFRKTRNSWIPHSGFKMKGKKKSYDPELMRLEEGDSE